MALIDFRGGTVAIDGANFGMAITDFTATKSTIYRESMSTLNLPYGTKIPWGIKAEGTVDFEIDGTVALPTIEGVSGNDLFIKGTSGVSGFGVSGKCRIMDLQVKGSAKAGEGIVGSFKWETIDGNFYFKTGV